MNPQNIFEKFQENIKTIENLHTTIETINTPNHTFKTISIQNFDSEGFKKQFCQYKLTEDVPCVRYFVNNYWIAEFEESRSGQDEYRLTIKKLRSICYDYRGEIYPLFYKFRILAYNPKTNECKLYLNFMSNKPGSARKLTYKDLTKNIISFINDSRFHSTIHAFLKAIALEKNEPFLNDIKSELFTEKLMIPQTVESLTKTVYHNKKDFLEKEYHHEFPNRANKEPLIKSILIEKAKRYIPSNQLQKYWEVDINTIDIKNGDLRQTKVIFFILYDRVIRSQIGKNSSADIHMFAKDYARMAQELKQTPSHSIKTLNGLMKKHDEIMVQYRKKKRLQKIKKYKGKPLEPENSVFKKFKLPKEFNRITKIETLYDEGETQHNCVFSYADSIQDGDCIIYSCTYKDVHYTIEIEYDFDGLFYLAQIHGPYNEEAPKELIERLQKHIDKNNKTKKGESHV